MACPMTKYKFLFLYTQKIKVLNVVWQKDYTNILGKLPKKLDQMGAIP